MPSISDHFRIFSDREEHGNNLFFNTRLLGSVPFRGPDVPPLKSEEYDELEVRPVAKVKTFNLAEDEDREEYQLILHRIVNGWYVKLKDYHHFDPETKSMWVHLEWAQLYKEIPSHSAHALREDVKNVP